MDAVRWLLLGAGDIATRRVAPALAAAGNSALVAVCDIEPGRAAALAQRFGVREVYGELATGLAECEADAVYIATPQHTHIELSLAVLAADKHLLCEKPLGLNGAECLRLLEAARRSERVTSCSNYRRLSEQVRVTETMLAREEIGYSTPFYNPGKAPVCQALGMSRIKELGYYLIDLAHNVLGMPCAVMAHGSILHPDVMNDVEELATVVLRFPQGEMFTILLNCTSPGTRHELELFGTEGRIYWPHWPPHGNGPVVKITAAGTEEIPAHTAENWHLPMIEDYVQAVLTGRQPVCTLESAVKTEVITDAVFHSLGSGRVEAVAWEKP
jgi:predicted dehydrogenase